MAHGYPKGVTLDDVWATLKEITEKQAEWNKDLTERNRDLTERQKETDRMMKENAERRKEEIDRLVKENAERQKETERQMKETERYIKEVGKQLGDFKNTFGEVIEHMVSPNLLEKFRVLGYEFQGASTRHKVIDKKNDIKFEIDVFLQNGDTAMLVEIKSDLSISAMNRHITRLEKMRKHADSRGDKRRFLGAVAGIVIGINEREYALSQGFFVIEPSGEDYNITPPNNKPREW